MATSRRNGTTSTFADDALALAAGAWSELGVSGWISSHADWAIDPEPLILFTVWLGDADPRLRDESTDWCVQNWRFISKARLKNLLGAQPEEVPALVNYLNVITRGRVTGEVPATIDIRVVPTVEDAGDEAVAALARKVRSVPVSDALPRLWGRNATLLEDDREALPDPLAKLVDELAGHGR